MGFSKTPYNILKRKILFEYLEKYMDTPTRTLARMLYRDHSMFYKDEDSCRTYIRLYRGQKGLKERNRMKLTKYYKDVQTT